MTQLSEVLLPSATESATPISLLQSNAFDEWQNSLDESQQAWIARQSFKAATGQVAWLEDEQGARVVCGWDGETNLSTLGHLPLSLPEGIYRIDGDLTAIQVLGWALGAYQFDRYKSVKRAPAQLVLPEAMSDTVGHAADAIALGRDLINTPAADMNPSHLAAEVTALAETFDAECSVLVGDELLDLGAGAIHAVGRAADDPPRLADLHWGKESDPKLGISSVIDRKAAPTLFFWR